MKKIVKIIAGLAVVLAGVVGVITPAFAADSYDPFCTNLPDEIDPATVGCSDTASDGALPDAVTKIINFVIGAGGLVAVAYMVVGGIGYITANGDAGKVAKAKNTILYALIGLVITALAFAIVNFAISGISGGSSSGGTEDESAEEIENMAE